MTPVALPPATNTASATAPMSPTPSAPIDELDFLLAQNLSGLPSGVQKGWVFPGTGTAEYANPHAMVTFAVERRLRYALRVATTSSKDRAPGLFVVTNRKFTGHDELVPAGGS